MVPRPAALARVWRNLARPIAAAAVIAAASFAGAGVVAAQETATVRGYVRAEGSGAPLAGAVVELRDAAGGSRSTLTDSRGAYGFAEAAPGRGVLRVRHVGFSELEVEILVGARRTVAIDVTLAVRPIPLRPVMVETDRVDAAADSTTTPRGELAIVETRAIGSSPGFSELGIADAVRGIPGKEPADPASVLYVRGAPADLKLVYLDGAPIYAPFPLGGLMEPFAEGLLNRADIYLGGAPARYDGGLSYVMDLRTRGPRAPGVRIDGGLDLLTGRIVAEAGFGDRAGIIASGRGMHQLVGTGAFASDLPYGYGEGLLRASLPLGSTGQLSTTGFVNDESVWLEARSDPDSVIRWGNRAGSTRLGGVLGRTAIELTAAIGDYSASLPLSGNRPLLAEANARRTRFSADFARRGPVQLRYGVSLDHQSYEASATDSRTGAVSSSLDGSGRSIGVYAEASGQIGRRLRVRGGARADHFSTRADLVFAPRLAATLLITESAAMTVAAGTYHQFLRPPDEVLLSAPDEVQLLVDGSLSVARASHVTVSLDQEIGENVRLGIEGFYKDFSDIPGNFGMAANASGVDFWVGRSAGSWTGWAGYSLAWVWSRSNDPGSVDFSGRHLLSSGIEATLRERTRVGFRFAYGAGLPYAGIPVGAAETYTVGHFENVFERNVRDLASADRGGTETAPMLYTPPRPYVRLDASISQHWEPEFGGRAVRIEPYLKVLNGLGRRDALFYFVEDGDDDPRGIGSLPVLPIAGLSIRF